jgi:hypothetical protein
VTLGGVFGFRVDLTEALLNTGQTAPDAFSFFLLDADALASLVSTTDPTGADSLVMMQADGLSDALASTPDLHVAIGPVSGVPEPSPLLLLAMGVVALWGDRMGRCAGRARAPR